MESLPRARVYIDGFNLYRRCLDQFPRAKWLDIVALSERLLPNFSVDFVHYFTARIKPGAATDQHALARQQAYLRALSANSNRLQIHFGKFRLDRRTYPKHPTEIDPATGLPATVRVKKPEEKGSDVHLAARMVFEASSGLADYYVVLSNDSDQVAPLKILKSEMRVCTGIIFPTDTVRNAKELMGTSPDVVANISERDLLACQLPEQLTDAHGKIHRPEKWR